MVNISAVVQMYIISKMLWLISVGVSITYDIGKSISGLCFITD